MNSTYRRYFLLVIALTFIAMALTVTTNLVVDPYGIWRIADARGFNAAKSERRNQTHLFKTFDLRRPLPPVLIIGSSRTAYGLDPSHPDLERMGGAYSAAIPGGHLTVVRSFLELALAANPDRIDTVIFGTDFFDFSEESFSRLPSTYSAQRMRPDRPIADDLLNVLLTLDALTASVATVASNLRDPDYQPYYRNGQLTAIDMRNNVERQGMIRRFRMSLDLYLNKPTRFANFQWSEAAFEEFENIVRICETNDVELYVVVPPTHAAHLESIRVRGLWDQFEYWKRRIAAVTPYWDFSGYNAITMEPMADAMDNYWDISHYRSNVGDLILTRLFHRDADALPGNFGQHVTEDNVWQVLADASEARADWLRVSTELLELIETIMVNEQQP